jgi:catechol 2,3-dioxygenase-like lactoylglutathione lyase family enzyme
VHDDEHLLILGSPDGGLLALSAGSSAAAQLPRTNHFGFRVADGGEVRAARERLRRDGVRELEWQDDGSFVRVQVADPDGYRVELYAF